MLEIAFGNVTKALMNSIYKKIIKANYHICHTISLVAICLFLLVSIGILYHYININHNVNHSTILTLP